MNHDDETRWRQHIRVHIQALLADGDGTQLAVMQRFEAAFTANDAAAAVACMAPDVRWSLPTGAVLRGRAQALDFLRQRFASADAPRFFDSQLQVMGDTVIQRYRVQLPTVHGGGEREGCDIYRIQAGLIASKDAYWKQISTAPSMPSATTRVQPPVTVLPMGDGVLRFEVQLPNAPTSSACSCQSPATAKTDKATTSTHLDGLISERRLAELSSVPERLTLSAQALLTPQARDWLRQRKVQIQRSES